MGLPRAPRRFGILMMPEYFAPFFADETLRPDCVVLNSDTFVGVLGGERLERLDRICSERPVSFHGSTFSVGSLEPLDAGYLRHFRSLVDRVNPVRVSDHLAWSSFEGHPLEMMPLPYNEEVLAHVVRRVGQIQDALGRQILLENPSTYLTFAESTMTEWEFLAALADTADCGILLDVNNACVSAHNNGFDPLEHLRGLPADRVGEIHLAGHREVGGLCLDTHESPIPEGVWTLYDEATRRFGAVPTTMEWGSHSPPFAQLMAEYRRAAVRAQAGPS